MSELFGVSMNLIMFVLLAILFVGLASVGLIALRNRVMFRLGVRNIPRRRAQTILIVVGLMLSTVIISAAFTTGDTVDRSVTSQVYRLLGSVDETIVAGQREEDEAFGDENDTALRDASFDSTAVAPLIARLRQSPDVDAVIPTYGGIAVAVNLEERLSSPLFTLIGLDAAAARNLPDLKALGSGRVGVGELGAGEIYLNRSAAEDLNLAAGDSVTLFTEATTTVFVVRAVIEDGRLAGSVGISTQREGGVAPLTVAQSFFGAEGKLTMIAVSNRGDARGGYFLSPTVEEQIDAALPPETELTVQPVKRLGVDLAEEFGNIFTTFFLAFGLFSIGAGVLLIFMIFVMLATERKSEMGMARAVGTKRMDLVQTFISEGMAYNVAAAMVGTAIGILVAVVIAKVMGSVFEAANLDISPHVTLRSLVVSYSLGVVLTFLTVTFASWRISLINIVRAIRDIPDPPQPVPQWGSRGVLATLRDLIFKPADRTGWRRRGVGGLAALLAVAGGDGASPLLIIAALLFAGVLFSHAWSQRSQPPLMRVGVFIGSLLVAPFSIGAAIFMTFQLGPLFLGAGAAILATFIAADSESAFVLLFGLSLAPLGLALILRSFGANERFTYTLLAVYLIYIWEFDVWDTGYGFGIISAIFGEADGDIEMFFISGVMVTLAATFLVVYNADLVLKPLTRGGRWLGALLPSIKMAVAYPLANKMRTGMTMAMFCLVIFALIVISSMNHNFTRLFLGDNALGGWDISVDENPSSPLGDLRTALSEAGSPAAASIAEIGLVETAIPRSASLCQTRPTHPCDTAAALAGGRSNFTPYDTRGVDAAFIAANQIGFQARAQGYASDAAVWQALAGDETLAVVDANALIGNGGFGSATFVAGIDNRDTTFDAFTVTALNPETGESRDVQVIGVVDLSASTTFYGLLVSQPLFDGLFDEPDARTYFLRTADGADNIAVARQIEASLLTTGAQAVSLRKELDDQSAAFSGFFYLMQGFMGLGLFVGVAAVGVIAFRTIVERRQQIGMLRSLGYTRSMIGVTFLIESAFIAFMGILSGVVFALILARQLITEQFANQGVNSFSVPWPQVLAISGLAFGAALLMTLIPARQAASIPIAEALRYE